VQLELEIPVFYGENGRQREQRFVSKAQRGLSELSPHNQEGAARVQEVIASPPPHSKHQGEHRLNLVQITTF
jgi:hypothetical protein